MARASSLALGAALAAAWIAAAGPIQAQEAPPEFVQRLRILAQLQTLNATLLGQDSATAALQTLCDRRSPGNSIQARKLAAPDDLAAAAAARRQLGAPANAPIRLRRVELTCGGVILSRADNWYLPDRLTQAMNTSLQSTETPFGVVVRPLAFQRRTISARLLFNPLPAGWELQPPGDFDIPVVLPAYVLQHRAVLQTPDGRAFSLLTETYTAEVLVP